MDNLSRRTFLRNSGAATIALVLGGRFDTSSATSVFKPQDVARDGIELNAWIIIGTDGRVTLVCHRAEMGQGVYQSLPQILAEELEVDLDAVDVVFAPGNNKKYGSQITGGSSSVRINYKKLLPLAASAREMLVAAAAGAWAVSPSDCYAESGHVIHRPSGRRGHYGEFVLAASKLDVPANVSLKSVADYRLIRQPLPRKDIPQKINGQATFGMDIRIDGMLYAAVERSPRLHGKIKRVDDSAARKVPGVRHIVPVKMGVHRTFREGIAVVATSTWAAFQGKKALVIEWDDSGFEHVDSDGIYRAHREALSTSEGLVLRETGDPTAIIARAEQTLDVVYETPYESHSCMEPLNCTAHYRGDALEIWGPIQAPEWIQDYIAADFGMDRNRIIVHMTFLGGGFGRKAFMDYPHEAAQISRAVGAPVQVVWTREDDMTQSPFRPGVSYRCEGAVEDGRIAAMKVRLAGQSNDHWRHGDASRGKPNRSAAEGLLKAYFDELDHLSIADVPFETTIPTMQWRSVYASTNGFAFESFIDELAVAAGADPIAFRRRHLSDERLHRLLDKLESVSGWRGRGSGFGFAVTECFQTTAGQVVKVSRGEGGGIAIDKVWVVIDCGWYVNPDTIRAQVEGSVVMALGAAAIHEITFGDGRALQQNFDGFPLPKLADVPPVEVHIMDNDADAGGVGEPGLPAFAPALANAIFDLTGQRIRKLPIRLAEIQMT